MPEPPQTSRSSSNQQKNNKSKRTTPCNGKRDGDKDKEDGSEFGLVPRYILKKSGRNVVPSASGAGGGISRQGQGKAAKNTGTITTTSILSPPRIKRRQHGDQQQHQHQQLGSVGTPTTIASEVSSMTVKSEDDVAKLMDETDALLDKKWFISQWTSDQTIGFRREKELLLKTEGYDPEAAARRIEDHIKTKVELFKLFGHNDASGNNNNNGYNFSSAGSTTSSLSSNSSYASQLLDDLKTSSATTTATTLMGKRISLNDLGKTHKKQIGIEDGYVQLVPTRDLQGRAILFFHFDAKLFGRQPQLFRKFLYYMAQSALEDDETTDKGIVLVVWNDDPAFLSILDPFWQPNVWGKIRMPYRIMKLHYCQRVHDSTPYSVQEKRDRGIELVMHQGSLHEIMHGLISYGVPAHFLPLNAQLGGGISNAGMSKSHDDLVETSNHLRWIELRRRIESLPLESQDVIVLVPSRNDVLLGKNRKTSMPGNVFYHQQVASHLEAYHLANTELERDAICFEVYTAVADTHGRFLQLVEDVLWEDLDQQNAQHIIRMAFSYLLTGSTEAGSSSENRKCTHNEYDPFDFRDIFNGQQCWNLIHCKVGAPRCW